MAFIAPPHKAAHQKRHFSVLRSTLHLIRAYNSPYQSSISSADCPLPNGYEQRGFRPFRVTTCPGLLVTGRPRLVVSASRTDSFGFAPGDINNMPLTVYPFLPCSGVTLIALGAECLSRHAAARVRRSSMIARTT